jgi:nucleoside-diphosphate-sugar epimerase
MKILVTGATGFIGGAVARKLSQQGHEVLALSRSDAAAAKLRVAGLTPVAGDFAVPASLAAPAAQVDAIVSTASIGQVEGTPDSFAKDRDAVAVMTKALGESGKPLIFTSGSAIFGVFTKGEASPTIFDEDYPVPSQPQSSHRRRPSFPRRSSTPSAARWRRAPKRRRPCSRRPAFGES